MSIIFSEVWKVRDRGNGRCAVFERHKDHNGDIHEHRYSAPIGHDTEAALNARAIELNALLIAQEKASVKSDIESGADPDDLIVKHLTSSQKAKQVLRALMSGDSVKLLKAAQYVRQFTNAQIENHFTQSQRIRIRARQNYILDNQSLFDTDLKEEI